MVPVLFSTVSSPDSIAASCARGRKRLNMEDSAEIDRKRHSHSDLSDDDSAESPKSGSPNIDDDRRAHHNELERRRRDHIKDHFMSLKEAIPLLEGEKSSRALILKRAVEYIALMQTRLAENQAALDELKRRNEQLSAGIMENKAVEVVAAPVVAAPVVPAPVPEQPVFIPTTALSVTVPTTSTFVDCTTPSIPAVSSISSFTPVVPAARLSPVQQVQPVQPVPSFASLNDLAAILGIKTVEPATAQLQKDLSLIPDLSRLLSMNTLALKEQNVNILAPLLF